MHSVLVVELRVTVSTTMPLGQICVDGKNKTYVDVHVKCPTLH
jgi:hypothetical protein